MNDLWLADLRAPSTITTELLLYLVLSLFPAFLSRALLTNITPEALHVRDYLAYDAPPPYEPEDCTHLTFVSCTVNSLPAGHILKLK